MVIVLGLYGGICWLIFGKLGLLPWNGLWKGVTGFGGLIIALVVIGALNFQTPSGNVSVQGAVIDIAPNVSGTVTEVAVVSNTPVAKGDLLFRIDATTYAAEVTRLEASLIEARANATRLESDLDTSIADIERIEAQLRFGV